MFEFFRRRFPSNFNPTLFMMVLDIKKSWKSKIIEFVRLQIQIFELEIHP